jgi:hypothetical protein
MSRPGPLRTRLRDPRVLPGVAAAAVIAALAAFALASTWSSAAAIPQNDDWSFVRSALALHRTGEIRLQGWGQMFMVGQLVSAQPFLALFGARTGSLLLYGVTMTAVWMWCSFLLARRCVGPRRAVLLVGVLALWPGLGLLASSFMTDLPAWAMSVLTLVLGVRALERRSRGWFLACVVVGVFGFTIREQAIAGLGAVVVAALVTRRLTRRLRVEVLVVTLLAVVLCLVAEHLRHQLPHSDTAPFGLGSLRLTHVQPTLLKAPFTLGLELSPLALWALASLRGRADWLDPGRVVGWVLGLAGLVFLTGGRLEVPRVVLSNYLTSRGAFSVASVGSGPEVIASQVWVAAHVVAATTGLVLLGEVGARLRRLRRDREVLRDGDPAVVGVAAYTALLAVGTLGLSFAGQDQFDRYLICFLPGLGVLLLAVPARAARPAGTVLRRLPRTLIVLGAVASAVLLAVLSVSTTLGSDRRDGAVWQAATRLTRQGVPATEINAGLDWNGFHATAPLDREATNFNRYRGQHWMYLFPEATDCWVVSVAPIDREWMPLQRTYPGGAGLDTPPVHVYRNSRCR